LYYYLHINIIIELMEQDESEYEAWKESIANLDNKQKKKAVKKKFTKLQEEHQTLKGAKARGKLAVAEMKGCDWLHKKVAGLKLNPREVEKSTAGRKKETSTKAKISVSEYHCYILLSIIINYILLSIIINYILLSIIICLLIFITY
jgi:hypothetical protein